MTHAHGTLLPLAAALFAATAASAASITAEDGLDLVQSATLPNEVFTAADGATIRVAGADAARPGLTVHRMEGLADLRRPNNPVYGKDCGARTNLVFDSALSNAAPTGSWIHQGRWHAPATGLYSFAAAFDDKAGLLIDGRSILAAGQTLNGVRDVSLAQGWHDVEIVFLNEHAGMGTPSAYAKGLVWSADNIAFTDANVADGNLFADPGDGTCLQQVHSGTFCRRLDIPSGTATLDLTQSGLAGPFCFANRTGLRTGPGAKLLVRGASQLVFNGSDDDGVHLPLLDADVAFEDAPEGRVRIVGKASIERMRPNYVIEDGSEVAYWGTNMVTDAEWTLTNRNAQLLTDAAVSPATKIRVAGGSTLTLKPCRHNPSDTWSWQGVEGTFPHAFELLDQTGCLLLRGYRRLVLTGPLSGDGDLAVCDGAQDGPVRLTGDLRAFTGTFRVQGFGQLSVEGPLPDADVSKIVLGQQYGDGGGRLAFAPEGAGETRTHRAVARVWGLRDDAYLEALANQEITVRTFGGIGGLKTANLTDSHITVESLDADATLVLRYTANVTVLAAGTGARVQAVGNAGQPGRLELGPSCGTLDELALVDGAVVTLAGTGTVLRVTGAGTVVLEQGAVVLTADPAVEIRHAADAVVRDTDAAALASALGPTPALWLDASRPDTTQQYLNCVFTNGPVVRRWNDCRADQTGLYGLNPRGEGYVRVYPYVMTNALNGRNVVSMGAVNGRLESRDGHVDVTTGQPVEPADALQPETRRLPLNRPIRVRTAILVFGSQLGGGGAMLGGNRDATATDLRGREAEEWAQPVDTACAFARGGEKTADFQNPETPIFWERRNCWVDGVAVDPTKTGFSGGWQIVSFESKTEAGEEVRSLGMIETHANAGGQNYAEVLLYTNALTAAERAAVELHLARKWGLWGAVPVNGSGQMEISDVFPAEGAFAGTVAVQAGGCLDLGAAPLPMTEAEMPTEGRVGWFDPDCAASLERAGASEPGCEDAVYGLFDRGKERIAGTPYLHGAYNSQANNYPSDRRPRARRGVRGDAAERTWIDFFEDPADKAGNTLRVKTNPDVLRKNAPPDYSYTSLPVRTAFIACDSQHGGGNPIADTVTVDALVKRREVANAYAPIWPAGTADALTAGETRLNGQKIDGRTTGFTGAPEVLSFTTTETFPAAFFGSCGTGKGERSYEVLGEIVLFSREVVGAERARIEAYLMNKWTGRLPAGWCDWRRATVTGAGQVKAPAKEVLPAFAPDFTGSLALAGDLSFHVDAANNVMDALLLPPAAALTLPATGVVSVSFAGRPTSCTLATAGTIAGFDPAGWTLQVTPKPTGSHRLVCADGALRLVVHPIGTLLLVR